MKKQNNTISSLTPSSRAVQLFILVFYLAGVTGIIIPWTNSLFLRLIPTALILSFVILAIFHCGGWNSGIFIASLSVYLFSFAAEVIGVNTGLLFGEYRYGDGLGYKVFGTPLIIGINWLMLVYMTASVTQKYNFPGISGIITASIIMLLYDIILEQVAHEMDMWHWINNTVPLQNYIVWFILAVGFHSIFKALNINARNKMAEVILICQVGFFLALFLYYQVLI